MVIAYFDESYSHPPAPVVYTVAGYIAEAERWQIFTRRWQAILDKDNLPPFSMKDYDNPHSKNYGSWDKERKTAFLLELHKIIKDTYIKSFSTSILQEDYDALAVEAQFAFGKPHSMAATNCLKLISEWADKKNLQEPISYVFEKGSGDDKTLNYLYNTILDEEIQKRYRIKKLDFDTKKLQPLQAADMVAYETRKETGRRYFSPERHIRKSMKNLHDPVRDEWVILDMIQMEKITNHPAFLEETSKEEFKLAAALAKQKGKI
jgi:hypothetical protein